MWFYNNSPLFILTLFTKGRHGKIIDFGPWTEVMDWQIVCCWQWRKDQLPVRIVPFEQLAWLTSTGSSLQQKHVRATVVWQRWNERWMELVRLAVGPDRHRAEKIRWMISDRGGYREGCRGTVVVNGVDANRPPGRRNDWKAEWDGGRDGDWWRMMDGLASEHSSLKMRTKRVKLSDCPNPFIFSTIAFFLKWTPDSALQSIRLVRSRQNAVIQQ